MKKGDILWIDLGNPPGGSGREQAGTRPGIAISQGDFNAKNPMLTIIPLTSSMNARRFPYSVMIKRSKKNGLPKDSIAMVFQIRSVDKRRVNQTLGHLEDIYLAQIEEALANMLLLKLAS